MKRFLRTLVLTGFLALPVGAQSSAASPLAIGETFTLPSRVLSEERRINVYLPYPYADSSRPRLPVLYMPDGGMAEDFLHVAGLVQIGVANGTMRPFILVGIENTERRRDMTGPTDNPEDRKIAKRVSGSVPFRQFIRNELMPEISQRYRTTSEKAIVGESLAGLFVVETLLLEPDLFDTYIALDPSLWWNKRGLLASADSLLRKLGSARKTLWFASSDEPDLVDTARKLATVLEKGAYPSLTWHYEPMPGEGHGTIYHPGALRAFRAVFAPAKTSQNPR